MVYILLKRENDLRAFISFTGLNPLRASTESWATVTEMKNAYAFDNNDDADKFLELEKKNIRNLGWEPMVVQPSLAARVKAVPAPTPAPEAVVQEAVATIEKSETGQPVALVSNEAAVAATPAVIGIDMASGPDEAVVAEPGPSLSEEEYQANIIRTQDLHKK